MTGMERKYVPSEVKADGTTPGRWRQRFSVFNNVDRSNDRMKHGSFKRSLEERGLPPVVYSHDWTEPPMGQSLDAQETRSGLDVLYQLFVRDGEDHSTARKADAALRGGALKEGSFAFDVVKSREVEEEGKSIREVQDVDLFEVGPTLVGMNDATRGHVQAASLLASINLPETFAKMLENDESLFEQLSKSIAVNLLDLTGKNTNPGQGTFTVETIEAKWNGPAAMASCSSAGDFRQIAFERNNDSDPTTAAHWTLPHHPSPGANADPQGVSAALAALSGARGGAPDLKQSVASVRAHLEAHSNAEKGQVNEEPEGQVDEELAAKIERARRLITARPDIT